jgi:hypothetical protein
MIGIGSSILDLFGNHGSLFLFGSGGKFHRLRRRFRFAQMAAPPVPVVQHLLSPPFDFNGFQPPRLGLKGLNLKPARPAIEKLGALQFQLDLNRPKPRREVLLKQIAEVAGHQSRSPAYRVPPPNSHMKRCATLLRFLNGQSHLAIHVVALSRFCFEQYPALILFQLPEPQQAA